ncbi:ATP-binding cassette domain-containing protein [Nonomuraea wenchangensis]
MSDPLPYPARSRLSDWWNGFRDGREGIPARSPAAPHRQVTTPHRNMLLGRAGELYQLEYLSLQERLTVTTSALAKAGADASARYEARLRGLEDLREATAPLGAEERDARLLGDRDHPIGLVRKRRRNERERRIAQVRRSLAAVEESLARAEHVRDALTPLEEQLVEMASARARRIREHTERRIAAYLRPLLRRHPHPAWAAERLGGPLDLPAWALAEHEEVPIAGPEREEPPAAYEIELLTPESIFGAQCPPPFLLREPGAAPRQFRLVQEEAGLRLRDYGHGNGPYIDGRPVRSALLHPGDHFDFGDHRYVVRDGRRHLGVTRLGVRDLIVAGLEAESGGRYRLRDMSFVQREGTVLAIVGPSGAGKSSLFHALLGELPLTAGELYFEGLAVREHREQIRERLGFVPQEIDLFGPLTVEQLLRYAYRLRGPGTQADDQIDYVCGKLELRDHRTRLVSTLSGGQRRRVSIAMELLNEPKLLMLDEPTSGLDLGLDRQLMTFLREYASLGNTVMIITHATEHLHLAEQALVVVRGGRPVYAGSPAELTKRLGVPGHPQLMVDLQEEEGTAGRATELAEEYARLDSGAEARAAAEHVRVTRPETAARDLVLRGKARLLRRQLHVLLLRQIHLVLTRGLTKDRRSPLDTCRAVILASLPLLVAALSAVLAAMVTGPDGLGPGPSPDGATALTLLTTLAVLSGQALSYGDIVGEYRIIQREHRTGVLLPAVVLAKWLVFAVVALLQGLLMTGVFLAVRPGPPAGLVLWPWLELAAGLCGLTVASMSLGLVISAIVRKLEQAVALVTATSVAQIALNGLTADLSGNVLLNALASPLPNRWGVAATASASNLRGNSPQPVPDALWRHTPGQWLFALAVVAALSLVYLIATGVALKLRLEPRSPDRGERKATS